jgi:pimeloyl-ACP methyl ester carboxylesterase
VRRALVAVAALVAAYWLVYPAAMSIVATEKPRAAVEPAELGRPYEEVSLSTADGLQLAGWYVPSRNGAAVIAFPGRSQPVPHARMLIEHGYGVLLLDMRGQGDSEGDPNAFGWESAKDVDAAVAYLQGRPDVRGGAVGGLGLSVGGEVLVEAAAQNPGLRAVVSEGAGLRSVRETFARQDVPAVQVWLQAPAEAVLTAATALLSADPPPASLEDLAARVAPRPILFVYGENGQETERVLTPAYAAAAGPTAQLWEVPGAGHTGGLEAQPEEYERRLIEFFDDALLGR